ncbi:SGNH family hydrolase, partial [Pseudomonas sp.]|uniref:SGNH/GDSL hydrolase family protein n=1 Tax=Pseudomonas sp. TaxID=306 RepID=UPI0028AC871A
PVQPTASSAPLPATASSSAMPAPLPATASTAVAVVPLPTTLSPAPSAAATPALGSAPLVTLGEDDEVFLVGDSLMQGVAPHLANSLLRRHSIRTLNLSRQSTGLAYPGFFNWPRTVTDTLAQHPRVRLMIVFLGPNDPWDMPQGKGKPFVYFKSPQWEMIYRERINAILDQARARHVQVIWVGPPNMGTPRLSTAMAYLSGLYQQQTALYGQHFVSANPFLGYQDEQFSATVQGPDGNPVKVRIDDGIHFTITGQKMIAAQLLGLIGFSGLTVTGH